MFGKVFRGLCFDQGLGCFDTSFCFPFARVEGLGSGSGSRVFFSLFPLSPLSFLQASRMLHRISLLASDQLIWHYAASRCVRQAAAPSLQPSHEGAVEKESFVRHIPYQPNTI